MNIKSADDARVDLLSLGECMVRLSPPGHGRIEFSPTLEVHVGGGEYNVAYALARLGMRTGFLSRLVDNPIGRIILNHGRAVGVDMSQAIVAKYDGVGRADRIGLNFTEVGTGVRASVTVYDRGHSAASNMTPGMLDFPRIFAQACAGCTRAVFLPRSPTAAPPSAARRSPPLATPGPLSAMT